ncbi:YybH family protein [candidate division KSB1 bacterium]
MPPGTFPDLRSGGVRSADRNQYVDLEEWIMKTIKILCTVVFLCAAFGCSSLPLDEEAVREELRTVLEQQSDAWNRADVDTFMEWYWNSEELTFTSRGSITRGWEHVLQRYKTNYTPQTMGHLTFSDLEITILSPESAFILGSWNLAREPDNPGGKFTIIFKKFPDGWKIVHDHTSNRETD